jgi:hypothetical protein
MRSNGHLRGLTGAAVAVLALGSQALLGVTPASAWVTPAVTLVQATSVSDSLAVKSVVVQCPEGKKVSGGGGLIPSGRHFGIPRGQVELTEMRPIADTIDSFRVTATEKATGYESAWTVTAYAICTDPLPGQQVIFATGPVDSFFDRITQVSCPAGKRVIGTGGRINSPGGEVHLREMGARLPDRDFASASAGEDADGFDGNWSLTTFAVCVDASVPVTTASAVSRFNTEPTKSLTAVCPAGTKVLGTSFSGGVPNLDLVATTLAPSDDLATLNLTMFALDLTNKWGAGVDAFCSPAVPA